jgi:hypothetical protein
VGGLYEHVLAHRSAGVTRTRFFDAGFLLAILAGLAAAAPARADTFLFDFENDLEVTTITPTALPSDTVSTQLNATFTSPQDPHGYAVFNAPPGVFTNLTGNYLATNAPGNGLDIIFAAVLDSLSVDFFLYGGATSVNYALLSGGVNGTEVASGTATGSITDGFGVEGILATGVATFDTIAFLPDSGTRMAIDNLLVDTAVPEPASVALLLAALVPLGALRGRRG